MRASMLVLCTLAVVLWLGASARAEGKDKGSGSQTTVQERDGKANQSHGKAPDVGADKGGKGGQMEKPAGPQGKKTVQAPAAAEKGKGKGQGQDQQAQARQKQLQHEQAKHMERQAKLNRIREIAVKKGDAEMMARVDKLLAKENEVFSRKLQQMQGQPRATPPLPGAGEKAGTPTVTRRPSRVPAPRPAPTAGAPEARKGTPAEPPKEKEKEQK